MELFDENALGKAIAEKWGEYGAHAEVYGMLRQALARRDALLREVLKQLREDSSFDLHVRIERELGDSHE